MGIGNVLFGPAILLSRMPVGEQFESCLGTVFFVAILGAIALELLWQLIGREVIEISDEHIVVRHQILGLKITMNFHAGEISGLFVSHAKPNRLAMWFSHRNPTGSLNFKQGKVAFNRGRTIWGGVKTFRFGTSLDEEEARQLVALIHKRFLQYVYAESKARGWGGPSQ
jgi:hypothetical protein